MLLSNVYDAKIRQKKKTAKRKTIFFIGKTPFLDI